MAFHPRYFDAGGEERLGWVQLLRVEQQPPGRARRPATSKRTRVPCPAPPSRSSSTRRSGWCRRRAASSCSPGAQMHSSVPNTSGVPDLHRLPDRPPRRRSRPSRRRQRRLALHGNDHAGLPAHERFRARAGGSGGARTTTAPPSAAKPSIGRAERASTAGGSGRRRPLVPAPHAEDRVERDTDMLTASPSPRGREKARRAPRQRTSQGVAR